MSSTDTCPTKATYTSSCRDALRAAGLRVTKKKLAVIDCLSKAAQPLSAPEVFTLLGKAQSKKTIDKVSVYRILETLYELKLVHRVSPSGKYIACFHQQCTGVHHVLARCSRCKAVHEYDVSRDMVSPLAAYLKRKFGFCPDQHVLSMDGLCAQCSRSTM